jgi:hypothetical protein
MFMPFVSVHSVWRTAQVDPDARALFDGDLLASPLLLLLLLPLLPLLR